MRAVGYVRINKADRDRTEAEQRLSLRQQAGEIHEASERLGCELLAIVEDFALSGNDDERPGLAKVAALVTSGDAEVVVVRHVDRLYRKGWRSLRLVDPVAEGGDGWNIYSVQQAFDISTPEGWFAFAQFALFGDFERRIIGKRTSAALAQLRKEGKHTGRPSLIAAEVEDRIAALHDTGLSASAVARQLVNEGVTRPVRDDRSGETQETTTWTHAHVLAAVRGVEARRLAAAAH